MHEQGEPSLNVSRETSETLERYAESVRKWNPSINLVSKHSLQHLFDRHIADSAQLFRLAVKPKSWCDLGSGAGFPGMVIAVLAKTEAPDLRVTLVESDKRKAAFLQQTARLLGVETEVKSERIEDLAPVCADVVSARALAPLVKLCGYAARHVAPEGCSVFPKGSRWEEEVKEARKVWDFDLETHDSVTDPQASILVLRNIRHV
jgi:16S rRNA (guanine527-N7)-methyltransferase